MVMVDHCTARLKERSIPPFRGATFSVDTIESHVDTT
jgi:hypothetical protein